jgi:AcrR family transcriptional regulator
MDSGDEGGLRERKKQRVREEIIAAGLKRFARDGFDATTIDDIVKDVGVSRRTFFRYFETKQDVVTGWFERARSGLREALEARPAEESPLESVRWAFAYVAGAYEADRAAVLVVERLAATTASIRGRKQERIAEHAKIVCEVFAKRLGMSAERDLAPRLIGKVAMAAANAAFETWVAGGGKASLPALVEQAMRFLETGGLPGVSTAAPRRPAARRPTRSAGAPSGLRRTR